MLRVDKQSLKELIINPISKSSMKAKLFPFLESIVFSALPTLNIKFTLFFFKYNYLVTSNGPIDKALL